MLDQGFEREMIQCLDLIKKKCPDRFVSGAGAQVDSAKEQTDGGNYWSDSIKVNFVSATMNSRVESLGNKLMKSHVKVGFSHSGQTKQLPASEN